MINYENNKNKEARFYVVKAVIKIRVIKKNVMSKHRRKSCKKGRELKEMSYTCKKCRKVFDRNANLIRNQGTHETRDISRGFSMLVYQFGCLN